MKRACRVLAIAALMMLFAAAQIFAASDYGYQIQVYPGDQGTIGDTQDPVVIDAGKYGDWYSLDVADFNIQVKDEKYYVKGLREAGADNSNASIVQSVTAQADRDMSYVVSYGIKQNLVRYTVKYQDSTGGELLPDATYYGAVGDKPKVSYKYIEGYLPNAYNETKTLTENEADNLFVFIYRQSNVVPVVGGETTTDEGTTEDKSASGKTTTKTVTRYVTSPASRSAAGQTAAVATPDNNQDNAQGNNNQTEIGDNETPAALVDLDDNDVPLASGPQKDGSKAKLLPLFLAVGAAIVIGLLLLFLIRRRKRMQEAV